MKQGALNTENSLKPEEDIPEPSQSIETHSQPAKPENPAVAPVEVVPTETIPSKPREAATTQKLKDNNLQMILPHLTVTTIKQEPKDSSETANSVPVIKQEPVEYSEGATSNPAESDSSMLKCPLALCSSEIFFKTRSEILLHLTQAHFTEGLLELFPFTKGQPCKICVDEKRPKVLIAQIRNRHIAHIGVNHGIVLDLLPVELKEVLMALPARMRRMSRPETPSSVSKPQVDITLDEAPAPVVAASYPRAQSYPSSYNFNFPTNTIYPQHNQPPTNYPDQGNYAATTYPPVQMQYPTYPDYSQYPTQPPVYPSSSFSSHAANVSQVKSESVPQTIKEEPKSAVKEEPKVVIKQEPLDHSEPVYKCTLCTARSFNQRSDLLFHLSITHFSRNLNQLFPFKDNQLCSLCNQFKPKNMSSHISHVGLKHEEVIKLLPPDLASSLAPAGNMNTKSSFEKPVEKAPVVNNKTAVQEKQPIQKPTEIPVAFAPPASDPEEPTVQCSLCQANNKVRLFTKRSEFLKHLSLLHFGKTLLQAFPFAEGKNCNLCFETSKKLYTPSKKEVHVCHVGVLHAKIFELLPKEILQQVKEIPTLKKVSALDIAMPNPQARSQQPQAEQKPPQPIHGTAEVPPTQSVNTDIPAAIPVQSPHAQNFATPSLPPSAAPDHNFAPPFLPPSASPVHNFAPPSLPPTASPVHNFAPPPPVPVSASPRDVAFKLPTTNLPSKDEFKLPMMKTDKPYNCRYCVSGFDVAKDLKDHLLTHKSQFSQINQTPRKGNPSSLVHLRMNTPRK